MNESVINQHNHQPIMHSQQPLQENLDLILPVYGSNVSSIQDCSDFTIQLGYPVSNMSINSGRHHHNAYQILPRISKTKIINP